MVGYLWQPWVRSMYLVLPSNVRQLAYSLYIVNRVFDARRTLVTRSRVTSFIIIIMAGKNALFPGNHSKFPSSIAKQVFEFWGMGVSFNSKCQHFPGTRFLSSLVFPGMIIMLLTSLAPDCFCLLPHQTNSLGNTTKLMLYTMYTIFIIGTCYSDECVYALIPSINHCQCPLTAMWMNFESSQFS